MKYDDDQRQQIKELLDNSPNFIEKPLFGENKPYYNTRLAREYLERYKELALELNRSNYLTKIYDLDLYKLKDSELQPLIEDYKEKEKALQRQYIEAQQEIVSTINNTTGCSYRAIKFNLNEALKEVCIVLDGE